MLTMYYKNQGGFQLNRPFALWVPLEPIKTLVGDDEYVCLERDGYMTFSKGYAWDGPSAPKLFIKAVGIKKLIRASLVHDGLYQLMRQGKLPRFRRQQVDKLFQTHCHEDGMSSIVAWGAYCFIRELAENAASAGKAKPVLSAP